MNDSKKNSRNKRRKSINRLKIAISTVIMILIVGVGLFIYEEKVNSNKSIKNIKTEITTESTNAKSSQGTSTDKVVLESSSSEIKEDEKKDENGFIVQNVDGTNYENLSKKVKSLDGDSFDQQLVNLGFIGTAIVVKNDQILLHKAYGYADASKEQANTLDSRYQVGSTQKSFTATMILKLIEDKKISFDTLLSEYYPQIQGANEIKIYNMINMTSGLSVTEPEGITDEKEILNYYINNVVYSGVQTYSYQAVNYALLAGIIEKIKGSDYYKEFSDFYSKVGLKNYGFYQDLQSQKGYTVAYKNNDGGDPYALPVYTNPDIYARELGTGNLDITAGDLYYYFSKLLKGQIVSPKITEQVWGSEGNETGYVGGMHNRGVAYRSFGAIASQRTFLISSKDGKNVIILMSNYALDKKQFGASISAMYQELTGDYVEF